MGICFLRFGKFSVYYFVKNIMYTFDLHLFSFPSTHDSQVCSFDEVAEFSDIHLAVFNSFVSEFFCFSLNIYFVFQP
jgi:hypothetical protein